ncbi:MAG: hypothetical protein ACTSPN_00950 [Promethearchaeota archaeon]
MMKQITQKKLLSSYLLFILTLTFATGFMSYQPRTPEVQAAPNVISSSQMKALDGNMDDSISYSYALESEHPHSSAVMERPTIGEVSVLALTVYFPDMPYFVSSSQIEERWDLYVDDYYQYNIEEIVASVRKFNWWKAISIATVAVISVGLIMSGISHILPAQILHVSVEMATATEGLLTAPIIQYSASTVPNMFEPILILSGLIGVFTTSLVGVHLILSKNDNEDTKLIKNILNTLE